MIQETNNLNNMLKNKLTKPLMNKPMKGFSKDWVFVKMLAYAALGGVAYFVISGQNVAQTIGLA